MLIKNSNISTKLRNDMPIKNPVPPRSDIKSNTLIFGIWLISNDERSLRINQKDVAFLILFSKFVLCMLYCTESHSLAHLSPQLPVNLVRNTLFGK